jgi:uncharacterized protein (TIGR02391 family)
MTSVITRRPPLTAGVLESISLVLADTASGLTGSQIGKLLLDSDLVDVDPTNSKWKRLFNSFVQFQNKYQCSNHILKFIQKALDPVRYLGRQDVFEERRHRINQILSFSGYELSDAGKYRQVMRSETIDQAEQRASRLKNKLDVRGTHSTIMLYCKPELLVDNYFHSVFEATKSVAERLRELTGSTSDGSDLVQEVFSTKAPLLKINGLATETDRNEHIGLANIVKGMFSMMRNPTAHTPKLKFVIEEEDALDRLAVISFIHKQLDKANP